MSRRVPDWKTGETPEALGAVYGWLDGVFCFMSFLGYRPAWYLEWYARPPYVSRMPQ